MPRKRKFRAFPLLTRSSSVPEAPTLAQVHRGMAAGKLALLFVEMARQTERAKEVPNAA